MTTKIRLLIFGGTIILLLSFNAPAWSFSANNEISFWPFNEGTGSTAYDVGSTYNFILNNMENEDWIAGNIGKALDFDGVNEYAQVVGYGSKVGTLNTGSISLWYKFEAGDTGAYGLTYGNPDSGAVDEINIIPVPNSPYLQFAVIINGSVSFNAYINGTQCSVGYWCNFTITSDGSSLKPYFNGVLKTFSVIGGVNSGQWFNDLTTEADADMDLFAGVLYRSTGQYYFDGAIDDIRVYNYELTPAEVLKIYTNSFLADSFDSYNLGDLNGQGDWIADASGIQVVDDLFKDGDQSIFRSTLNQAEAQLFRYFSTEGLFSGYLYIPSNSENNYAEQIFFSHNSNTYEQFGFRVLYQSGNKIQYWDGTYHTILTIVEKDVWKNFQVKWTVNSGDLKFSYNYDFAGWSDWINAANNTNGLKGINRVHLYLQGSYLDKFSLSETPSAGVSGITPESGTEITDLDTDFSFYYSDLDFENYDRLLVSFENNTTGESTLKIEYDLGDLSISGGTEIINIQDFNIDKNGRWNLSALEYNSTTDDYSDEIANDYYLTLNVGGLVTPYTFADPETWYSEHSTRYDEPSVYFTALTNLFYPIFEKVGDFGIGIITMFDTKEAFSRGQQLGSAFPMVEGYIKKIDGFFGYFPLASFLKYTILIMIGIFIVNTIMKFIPFFG